MKEPYVAIDIETTGLDPETCQILEIGAVIEDWKTPVEDLPAKRFLVSHPIYQGQEYALWMNGHILKEIHDILKGKVESDDTIYPERQVARALRGWLHVNGIGNVFTVGGKNVGNFDLAFLKRLPGWSDEHYIRHRVIDPAVLYWEPDEDGDRLPDLKKCKERAGITGRVAHSGVEDSLDVIRCVRAYYSKKAPQLEVAVA